MIQNVSDVLQILRFELNYLEQGGFERDRALLGTESPFKGTFACINYNDPLQAHACRECLLYQFVPEESKAEEFPCHHIQLNDAGETIEEFMQKKDPRSLVDALQQWLRATIARLEAEQKHNGDS